MRTALSTCASLVVVLAPAVRAQAPVDSALAAYQQAFGIDSDFTLAYAHAGLAAGWGRSGSDSLTTRYQLKAGSLKST